MSKLTLLIFITPSQSSFIIVQPLICETALRSDLSKTMFTHDAREWVPEHMAILQGRVMKSKTMQELFRRINTDDKEMMKMFVW